MEQAAAPFQNNLGSLILGQHASAFSGILIREHLDSDSRLALSRVNKAARDEVLITARSATCSLCLGSDDAHGHLAEAYAMKAALMTRGTRPNMKLHWMCVTDWPMVLLLDKLQGAGTGVHELILVWDQVAERIPTLTLSQAARAFPNLRSLIINSGVEAMPPPSLFPHLTTLSLIGPENAQPDDSFRSGDGELHTSIRSIAPYMSRLPHLTLDYGEALRSIATVLLFSPDTGSPITISHTLHTLSLMATLDDTLLGLLLAYTPALEVLKVRGVYLESDEHADQPCRWRQLTCDDTLDNLDADSVYGLDLTSLARLPSPPDGTKLVLAINSLICQWLTAEEELAAVQAATRMELQCKEGPIGLGLLDDVPVDEQPEALRAALDVLRAFTTQDAPQSLGVVLGGVNDLWTVSVSLMHELRALPAWGKLGFVNVIWLSDYSLYSELLSHLPASYHVVDICMADLPSKAHLRTICLGLVGRQQPLHIIVADATTGVVASIQQTLADLGVTDQVVVAKK